MGKKKRNKSAQAGGWGAVATEIRQVSPARPQGYSVAQASKPNFFTGAVFEWLAIAATSLIAFWFLTARIVGVQVSVLADEYLYLLDAHYKGLDEATYPNYLFQWIYSSTKLCGTEFYSCARSINAFFVIFGAIFIYLLAKHIGRSKWLGALAAVAAILGSYGTYTAYFMPEAIFNGLMMVFFWALIRLGKSDNLLVWAAIGTSLGIASLAKPHGLFVIPAIVIFVILWTRATKDKWLVAAALRSVVFVGSVVGSKFLFGYLLAGERALSLFGMYGTLNSAAQTAANTITAAPNNGTSVFFTAWGQVLMVTMILGPSLLIAVHGLIVSFKKDSEVFKTFKFRAVMGLSLLSLMPAIAIFESWQNLGSWMHTRYYTYLIPLAFIVLVEAMANRQFRIWPWSKYVVFVIFFALTVFNLFTTAAPYSSNWIDGPDFVAHISNFSLSIFLMLLGLTAAIIWIKSEKTGSTVAILMMVLLSLMTSTHTTSFLKTTFGQEAAYEHISRVLRDFLPQEELDRIHMVGQYELLQRVAFSSNTGSAFIQSSPEVALDRSEIGPEVSWLLTVGDLALTGFESPTIAGMGYSLYSLDPTNTLAPRNERIVAISNTCTEGSKVGWACGLETSVSMRESFPVNANVDLIFELSENAASHELEFVLGDSVIEGKFLPGIISVNVGFTNTDKAETLLIRSINSGATAERKDDEFVRVVWALARGG